MNGVLDCRAEDCPSLVTMAMTRSGNLSTFVLAAFVFLWLFMLVTSLHVFFIAIKTTRNNTVSPAGQAQEKTEEMTMQDGAQKVSKNFKAGLKKKMIKV